MPDPSPPIATSPTLALIVVRDLFDEARSTSSSGDNLATLKATLSLDMCVETVLRLACGRFGKHDEAERSTWGQLWGLAHSLLRDNCTRGLEDYGALHHLHHARNAGQHRSTAPHPDNLQEWISLVDTFLRDVGQRAFAIDISCLRVTAFVRSERLREGLDLGARALPAPGEAHTVLAFCRLLHDEVLRRLKTILTPHEAGHDRSGMLLQRLKNSDVANGRDIARAVAEVRKDLAADLEDIELQFLSVALGMPLSDAQRFRFYRSFVRPEVTESGATGILLKTNADYLAAGGFALDYAARLALRVEAAHPTALEGFDVHTDLWGRLKSIAP